MLRICDELIATVVCRRTPDYPYGCQITIWTPREPEGPRGLLTIQTNWPSESQMFDHHPDTTGVQEKFLT